jgi:hypothetical protein
MPFELKNWPKCAQTCILPGALDPSRASAMGGQVRNRSGCSQVGPAMEWRPVTYCNSSRRLRNADLRVNPGARPGWEIPNDRIPTRGEKVYCTEGAAEVARICGRTGDGSRVLELRILERTAPPFYAAASNVLVRSMGI